MTDIPQPGPDPIPVAADPLVVDSIPTAAEPVEVREPVLAANEAPPINTPLLAEQLPPNEPQVKPARLLSLDIFRGLTLAMMTIVNNKAGASYTPLEHADWGMGWTSTDLVFPFFLFIVGVAIPFSLGKRATIGQTRKQLLGTIWLRALSLFMVGQLLQGIGNVKGMDLPPGFHVLPILRWICMLFGYAAVFVLLTPWRPTRRAWMIPVGVCVGFYGLACLMALVNANALNHGLPLDKITGGGLFKPAAMRIPGVLQRIGFCYGVAATIMLYAGWRTALLTTIGACLLYTVLMFYAPFHDQDTGKPLTGTTTEEHNFARSVDEAVFIKFKRNPDGSRQYNERNKPIAFWNHTWRDYPDNEGIVSTLPSLANALIGAMAGLWLRTLRPAGERCAGLFVFGVFSALLGCFLDAHSIPIIKDIWTPSYAFLTAGLGLMMLAIIFFIVDINGHKRWGWPFIVLGMNSIAVFVANSFLVKAYSLIDVRTPYQSGDAHTNLGGAVKIVTSHWVQSAGDWFHHAISPHLASVQSNFAPHGSLIVNKANDSLAYALAFLLVVWLLMLILYVCKIFVKI